MTPSISPRGVDTLDHGKLLSHSRASHPLPLPLLLLPLPPPSSFPSSSSHIMVNSKILVYNKFEHHFPSSTFLLLRLPPPPISSYTTSPPPPLLLLFLPFFSTTSSLPFILYSILLTPSPPSNSHSPSPLPSLFLPHPSSPFFSIYIITLYLHFHCESLNEPLHLRCGSYLYEQIALSHTHIRAI